jgi:hypothetical protein
MKGLNMVVTLHYLKSKILPIVLVAVLTVSFGFNLYQSLRGGGNEPPSDGNSEAKEFTFYWLRDQQDIVNGTLRINLTTFWTAENLTLIVNVNDKKYPYTRAFAGLVFGSYENGSIIWNYENTLALWDNGFYHSYPRVAMNLFSGDFGFAQIAPVPSPYHNCTYIDDMGYVYNITLPKEIVGNSTLMNLHYEGSHYADLGLTRWVSVNFEGWR